MAASDRCPHCGNPFRPGLTTEPRPRNCPYCNERIVWNMARGWELAPAGAYEPMTREQAAAVIGKYPSGQPFTIGANDSAELIEAYLVLGGASVARIHEMRERILGPGAND